MPNKMLLIMGLSGSGKTTFAEMVVNEFHKREIPVTWFNADEIREEYNDWDFSDDGRSRAAKRMRDLVDASETEYNVVDMIAGTFKQRILLKPDYAVWMDTIDRSKYEDTDSVFTKPDLSFLMMKLGTWGTTREAISVVNMMTGTYK